MTVRCISLRYKEIQRRLATVFGKHQLALGFAICIALATTTMVLLLILIESTGNEIHHDHNTSIAYADAQKEFRDECLGRASIQELPGCLKGVAEAARETQRAEEDLYAQEQMAEWARWMFYATLIVGVASAFVATVGILLVSSTLDLQRTATLEAAKAARAAIEANKISHKTYVADQRPWIAAPRSAGGPITWGDKGCEFCVRFVLRNTGRTPALRVDIRSRMLIRHGYDDWVKEQLQVANGSREGYRSPIGVTIFPGDELPVYHKVGIKKEHIMEELDFSRALSEDSKPRIFPTVVGCVDYYFCFGGDISLANRRQTGFIFHVIQHLDGREMKGISPDDGEIPAHQIELRSWHLDGRTT